MIDSCTLVLQLQIIVAISEIPPFLASFLYPVIELSTNKDEPSHIYFLEDALELWLVVVQNSTTLTPDLLRLSGNLLPIIGMNLCIILCNFSINFRFSFHVFHFRLFVVICFRKLFRVYSNSF